MGFKSKGYAYLLFSNLVFFITGYAVYFGLARILSPESFGTYGVIISLVSVVTVVLSDSIRQTVSKFISEKPMLALSIKSFSLKAFFALGVLISLVYFALSGFLAFLLNDALLLPFIQFSSLLIILQILLSVFSGFFNGLKDFKSQALLDSVYFILKMAFILSLAFFGFGLMGAIAGFIIAVGIALGFGFLLAFSAFRKAGPAKPAKKQTAFSKARILRFGSAVMVFTLMVHLLNNIDLFFVKALSPAIVSSLFSGYYLAASTIARMPQLFVIAISAVLFPLVSESASKADIASIRLWLSQAFRYSLIILAFFAAFFLSNAPEIFRLVYSESFLPSIPAFNVLVFAAAVYSLFFVFSTAIIAFGKPFSAFLIALAVLALDFALSIALNGLFGIAGIAFALGISLFAGFTACLFFLKAKVKFSLNFKSILRIFLAAAVVFIASGFIKLDGFLLLADFAAAAVIFVLALFLLKETSLKEFLYLKKRLF